MLLPPRQRGSLILALFNFYLDNHAQAALRRRRSEGDSLSWSRQLPPEQLLMLIQCYLLWKLIGDMFSPPHQRLNPRRSSSVCIAFKPKAQQQWMKMQPLLFLQRLRIPVCPVNLTLTSFIVHCGTGKPNTWQD